jgi:hypothetical protein
MTTFSRWTRPNSGSGLGRRTIRVKTDSLDRLIEAHPVNAWRASLVTGGRIAATVSRICRPRFVGRRPNNCSSGRTGTLGDLGPSWRVRECDRAVGATPSWVVPWPGPPEGRHSGDGAARIRALDCWLAEPRIAGRRSLFGIDRTANTLRP